MMKLNKGFYFGIGFGALLLVAAFIFFRGDVLFYFLVAIALVVSVLPFVFGVIVSQGKQQEKEGKFLEFSRDLVENVRSGTPISKSIINLQNRDYGQLSPHIKKLANQLGIGLTLHEALSTFAKETKSASITRAVGLISEAERAGGKIELILDSVAKSINQTETLKKERKASISNLITQGYIIFLVFIVIMLVLEFKILPLVSDLGGGAEGLSGIGQNVQSLDPSSFSMPLLIMLLVQSFFAGLVIGKISEGTIKAGIKHSFILLTLTVLVTTGARALFGG